MNDTEEDREAWGVVKHFPVTEKIAMAAFLKVILPIEAMILIGHEDARSLRDQWKEAYGWLSFKEQDNLLQLSHWIIKFVGVGFQEKLENAVYGLIEESFKTRDSF
jgi:hypothetical protein